MPASGQTPAASASRRGWLDARGYGWCYLYLLPMVVMYLAFVLWPVIASWYFAFYNWDGVGWPSKWVGSENFRDALADPRFWNAFKNSWIYSLCILFIQVPMALVVATILNDPTLRGREAYRALFFLPVVATTAVIGVVLAVMLSPVGGPINTFLLQSGLVERPVNFLGAAELALPTVVAVGIWKWFGVNLVYWLAGLQSVPKELYESARVDGANAFQQMRFITLPVLRPVAITIFALALVGSLQVFDLVQVMTAGGPFYSSDVMGTYIFRTAFTDVPRFGFASAAGVLFGLVNIAIVVVQALAVRATQHQAPNRNRP